jgi:hypothetical protein
MDSELEIGNQKTITVTVTVKNFGRLITESHAYKYYLVRASSALAAGFADGLFSHACTATKAGVQHVSEA